MGANHEVYKAELDADVHSGLLALCRRLAVTPSTALRGAWGLALARETSADDVVFGATVSARGNTGPGMDRMIGLFLNWIPVRVRIGTTTTVARWLEALQRRQLEAAEFAWLRLSGIS